MNGKLCVVHACDNVCVWFNSEYVAGYVYACTYMNVYVVYLYVVCVCVCVYALGVYDSIFIMDLFVYKYVHVPVVCV